MTPVPVKSGRNGVPSDKDQKADKGKQGRKGAPGGGAVEGGFVRRFHAHVPDAFMFVV
jgi:hypothetical protein